MIPNHLSMRPPNSVQLAGVIALASVLPKNCILGEIGSFYGESSRIFLDSGNVQLIFCIDPWENNYDPKDPASRVDMLHVENTFDQMMKGYTRYVKVKRKSVDAATMFPDHFFDVVYIDGLHTGEGVESDILAYLPKIKQHGWLTGHDWNYPEIQTVCRKILQREPLFVCIDNSWVYHL